MWAYYLLVISIHATFSPNNGSDFFWLERYGPAFTISQKFTFLNPEVFRCQRDNCLVWSHLHHLRLHADSFNLLRCSSSILTIVLIIKIDYKIMHLTLCTRQQNNLNKHFCSTALSDIVGVHSKSVSGTGLCRNRIDATENSQRWFTTWVAGMRLVHNVFLVYIYTVYTEFQNCFKVGEGYSATHFTVCYISLSYQR